MNADLEVTSGHHPIGIDPVIEITQISQL